MKKELRYENKFVTELSTKEIELLIKKNKAFFKKAYPERQINNIYFDTLNKKSYLENEHGLNKKQKVRIRWYGKLKGKIQPILEIKKKKGDLTEKESYKLKKFIIENEIRKEQIKKLILNSDIPPLLKEHVKTLIPTLINSYTRKYYISLDQHYRFTIDDKVEYYHPRTLQKKAEEKNKRILELKYKHNKEAYHIANDIQLRLGKNSKYENGIILLGHYL